MSNETTIVRTVGSILSILGYTLKAIGKLKEKKYEEGFGNLAAALSTTVLEWENIQSSWEQIHITTKPFVQLPTTTSSQLEQLQQNQGFFTGQWYSSDKKQVELLYHDVRSNAVILYTPKQQATDYNVYQGGINLKIDALVWTGFNSLNHELVIVGIPTYEGQQINCHTWFREPQSNQIKLVEQFSMTRIQSS